jgi:hypothetical protein
MTDAPQRRTVGLQHLASLPTEHDRSPDMGNKNKGGREARKPKKNAKLKAAPVTSTVIPTTERPVDNKPK